MGELGEMIIPAVFNPYVSSGWGRIRDTSTTFSRSKIVIFKKGLVLIRKHGSDLMLFPTVSVLRGDWLLARCQERCFCIWLGHDVDTTAEPNGSLSLVQLQVGCLSECPMFVLPLTTAG